MERTKYPHFETVAKRDSNLGSLDYESGVLYNGDDRWFCTIDRSCYSNDGSLVGTYTGQLHGAVICVTDRSLRNSSHFIVPVLYVENYRSMVAVSSQSFQTSQVVHCATEQTKEVAEWLLEMFEKTGC